MELKIAAQNNKKVVVSLCIIFCLLSIYIVAVLSWSTPSKTDSVLNESVSITTENGDQAKKQANIEQLKWSIKDSSSIQDLEEILQDFGVLYDLEFLIESNTIG